METENAAPESALQPKARLTGKVIKTTIAGAIVDIGQKVPGVIHISQLQKDSVNRVEEIIQVKQAIAKATNELENEKKVFNKDIPLGAMIEVPSAAIMADHLAEHVNFFSIGTNDLIQYSLAIDRRNPQVAHLYQALNPAVLRMIKMTCDAAKKKGIEIVMCGEMAGDPINIPVLIGLGLTDLSMNSASIPVVKNMIRNIDSRNAKNSMQKIMGLKTVKEITDYITNEYKDILPFRGTDESI